MPSMLVSGCDKNPSLLLVSEDIDDSLLGVTQRFNVINGAWSGSYLDGRIRYKGMGKYFSREVDVYYIESMNGASYNEVMYNFERDVLGTLE